MGSRSKENLAYIAGFIDGDGSLMLQVKKRSDTKHGLRFMVTICLYQDSRHEKPLHWIRDVLKIGYVSKRCDGISELRINGYKRGRDILVLLKPYFKFKKIQAKVLLEACKILSSKPIQKLSTREQKKLVDLVLVLQSENYVTKKKRSRKELYKHLGLTP